MSIETITVIIRWSSGCMHKIFSQIFVGYSGDVLTDWPRTTPYSRTYRGNRKEAKSYSVGLAQENLIISRSAAISVNFCGINIHCHNVHNGISLILGLSGSAKTLLESKLANPNGPKKAAAGLCNSGYDALRKHSIHSV